MRRAGSVDDFLADRFGAYYVGRHVLAWCSDAALGGVVFWGAPDEADVAELERIFAVEVVPGRDVPYDVVADGRRLERVMRTAFEPFARAAARRIREQQPLLHRMAVITPDGLAGTVMAGFFHLFHVGGKQRLFSDAGAAFGWLGRPDALHALDAVLAVELEEAPLLVELRRWLAFNLADVTVRRASQALGRSSRSLQRELAAARSSFRREVERARVGAARARLADSDAKIESIAREVGCRSTASFAKLFRRVAGETPSDYRARVSGVR